jgi:hypothetical protein
VVAIGGPMKRIACQGRDQAVMLRLAGSIYKQEDTVPAPERVTLIHIFVDHSNIWEGARGASRLKAPKVPDLSARISIRNLHRILGGERQGVSTKIVSGGIPPGMEGVWAEYQHYGYDTQRLVREGEGNMSALWRRSARPCARSSRHNPPDSDTGRARSRCHSRATDS